MYASCSSQTVRQISQMHACPNKSCLHYLEVANSPSISGFEKHTGKVSNPQLCRINVGRAASDAESERFTCEDKFVISSDGGRKFSDNLGNVPKEHLKPLM